MAWLKPDMEPLQFLLQVFSACSNSLRPCLKFANNRPVVSFAARTRLRNSVSCRRACRIASSSIVFFSIARLMQPLLNKCDGLGLVEQWLALAKERLDPTGEQPRIAVEESGAVA